MSTYPQFATPHSAIARQPARAPKHAKPRRRMRPAARAAIRSVGLVLLTGVAIIAVVGGPGASASADEGGTVPSTAAVIEDRPRATPAGPAGAEVAGLLVPHGDFRDGWGISPAG